MNKYAEIRLRQLVKQIEEREGREAALKVLVSIAIANYVKGEICKISKEEINKSELSQELKDFMFEGVKQSADFSINIMKEVRS